jgi:hypothetical protein
MSLAEIYYLTVSISAVAAVVTFIISARKDANERRIAAIRKWQRALIQQILQSGSGELSFDEILQRYRNEAVAYRQYNLQGDDLSPQSMRLILIEMITQRILEQVGSDRYVLSIPRESIKAYKEVMSGGQDRMTALSNQALATMLAGMRDTVPAHIESRQKIVEELLGIVSDEPFRYNVAEVSIRIAQRLQMEVEVVRAQVLQCLALKYVGTDDRGRIGLNPSYAGVIHHTGDQ